MAIKFGVVVFPGSNCDQDAYYSLKKILGYQVEYLWHKNHSLNNSDVVILPGGFSYGDYIRTGAVAKLSPIMNEVKEFAERGGIVIGICNGFQILCESGLLPGVLLKNINLKFVCKDVYLTAVNTSSIFSQNINRSLLIPVAHGEGNYFCDDVTLSDLKKNNQIIFKYSSKDGDVDNSSNPNGSMENIAGIMNRKGNVFGMMPHPERVCNPLLGNSDGKLFFESIYKSLIK